MSIRFLCDNCGKILDCKSEFAGKPIDCPKCRFPLTVPEHSTISENIKKQPPEKHLEKRPKQLEISFDEHNTIRRIADFHCVIWSCWFIVALIQLVVGIAAIHYETPAWYLILFGLFNLIVSCVDWSTTGRVRDLDARVPQYCESVTSLVWMGAINTVLGGLIGIVPAVMSYKLRDMILSNRYLFERK